ncbi:MAG: homoserine dehydrogenase [Actinomycetota bacterium]|nr:homoserine dehydrogenase [Actinomycetota bacterium]
MSDVINIGLLGLGTVGRGVWQLLERPNDVITNRLGCRLKIKKILVRDPAKERGVDIPASLFITDAREILDDDDIQIVVEVIGGTLLARQAVNQALAAGKSVVTANKELMANFGQEVMEEAERRGADLFFEASVGAGIPIIQPLKVSLVGNRIQRVMGIINGTTNFILSKMDDGQGYEAALAEAQALGYAERDPADDIEGKDAAAKIAILASIAFNSRVTAGQVHTEGISAVSAKDIMYARELGYAVKLLAVAKLDDGSKSSGIDVRVHPAMIPLDHPLAAVTEAYNAIFVEGDAAGELMFFGQGAGSLPTAGAVVADVVLAADNIQRSTAGRLGCTCFNSWPIRPIDEVESSFYILIEAMDRPGVLAQIAKVFGDHQVSIGNVIQKQTEQGLAEVVFMTHRVVEGNLRSALDQIAALDVVDKVRNVIRVEVGQT